MRPPLLCMNSTFTPSSSFSKPEQKLWEGWRLLKSDGNDGSYAYPASTLSVSDPVRKVLDRHSILRNPFFSPWIKISCSYEILVCKHLPWGSLWCRVWDRHRSRPSPPGAPLSPWGSPGAGRQHCGVRNSQLVDIWKWIHLHVNKEDESLIR